MSLLMPLPKIPVLPWSPRTNFPILACAALFALFPLLPSRLSAQTPEQRVELERFRDSITATVDSSGLLALERKMIDSAKAHRSDGMIHLKLGFLSFRLGELGGRDHYDDAASEFQWAIDLQPSWPYAWYGMGLAE